MTRCEISCAAIIASAFSLKARTVPSLKSIMAVPLGARTILASCSSESCSEIVHLPRHLNLDRTGFGSKDMCRKLDDVIFFHIKLKKSNTLP